MPRSRENQKELRAYRRMHSLCYSCGAPVFFKYKTCNECLKKLKINKEKWLERNPERVKDYLSAENKERRRKRLKERFHEEIQFRIAVVLRGRISRVLKKEIKWGSVINDLGCTIDELKVYLESKFQDGMTWSNYGFYGWHIDHIIPLSHFDLTDREQFLKACHYTNLQPLWAKDNLRKHAKIILN